MDGGPEMIRASGTYARLDGAWRAVAYRQGDRVALYDENGKVGAEIPMSRCERVDKVVTEATWRGGKVVVVEVEDGEAGFRTNDQALATREGLRGHQHDGWVGRAAVLELSDVAEHVHDQRRST